MPATTPASSPTDTAITDAQRADFARRVLRHAPGVGEKRHTWNLLSAMPRDRVVRLTIDLWAQCEPSRRVRERGFRCYGNILGILFLVLLLCFVVLAVVNFSGKPPAWLITFQVIVQISTFLGNSLVRHTIVTPKQRACLPLLETLKDVRLTPALVDTLGWQYGSGIEKYRPALRLILTEMLPVYANSDAPPLDAYQQALLRGEIKGYTRRLHRSRADIENAEAEFIVAAVRYLSTLPASDTDSESTAAVLAKAAALTPADAEAATRRIVRETAAACLPLVQTARR